MPRFSLSTMMFCTLVLALGTAMCLSLRVTDFERKTVTKLVTLPNGIITRVPYTVYTPTGTHAPTGTDLLRRLSWLWPTVLAITLGTVWMGRRVRRMPRKRFNRIAFSTVGVLLLANLVVSLVYYFDYDPNADWLRPLLAGLTISVCAVFMSRFVLSKLDDGPGMA